MANTGPRAGFTQCNIMIDLILKAMAQVLQDEIIAGSAASISFASYIGVKPDGNYWVFLEVNEGKYGGRPRSDGPDSIDNLMANPRKNPFEDLAMHIPMICDRYALRDDVARRRRSFLRRHRCGQGAAHPDRWHHHPRIRTPHQRAVGHLRRQTGRCHQMRYLQLGRVEIRAMPSKFHGLTVKKDDV